MFLFIFITLFSPLLTSALSFYPTPFVSDITFCKPYTISWVNSTGSVTVLFWYQPPGSNPLAPQWNDVRLGGKSYAFHYRNGSIFLET